MAFAEKRDRFGSSEIPITSVPALLGLVELLSHFDGPVKELIFGPLISDICWEVLTTHFHRIKSVKLLNYYEIPLKKMEDLLEKGESFLTFLEGVNFGGLPEEGFLDLLLPILERAQVTYLDISGRKIGDDGVEKLLEVIQPDILNLEENRITDDGLEIICKKYAKKGNLVELHLDDNPITTPFPLLQLHHIQPLALYMPRVRFSSQNLIDFYDKLLELRDEGYFERVKHSFCYHLYSLNTLAYLLVRQFLLNVRGREEPLPLFGGTEVVNPYLDIMQSVCGPITPGVLYKINTHPDRAYLIAHFLSRHYTISRKESDLLALLADEIEMDKEALAAKLDEALPNASHLDKEERYFLAMSKIDPYPVFLFHKDSRILMEGKILFPDGEYHTLHFPIILYRTQEGKYYSLLKT